MRTKERYTTETIKVRPVDQEKLDKMINEFMHTKYPDPNTIYHTSSYTALIKSPKSCLIDDEFVGHEITNEITWYVYKTETLANGGKRGFYMPTDEVTMSLAEMEQYLLPETTLAEFTQGRRGYNSRVRQNEADWIRYFNK